MLKASSWNLQIQHRRRRQEREELYKTNLDEVSSKREALNNIGSADSDFEQFLQFDMSILEQTNIVFNHPKYTKIQWEKDDGSQTARRSRELCISA